VRSSLSIRRRAAPQKKGALNPQLVHQLSERRTLSSAFYSYDSN
jgi:hypothetical protein